MTYPNGAPGGPISDIDAPKVILDKGPKISTDPRGRPYIGKVITLEASCEAKYVEPTANPLVFWSLTDLAAALFATDPAVAEEAARRAEPGAPESVPGERLRKVLGAMWRETKPAERADAERRAKAVWDFKKS